MNDQEAINSITIELLDQQKRFNKRIFIALIVSILVNLALVVSFLIYESQWEYIVENESIETTVTQEQTENGGDNVFQTGENAVYNGRSVY